MTAALVVALVAMTIAALAFGALTRVQERHLADVDLQRLAAKVEADRLTEAVVEVLTPLTWAWEEFGDEPRLKHHLTQALVTLRAGLGADDVEMADRMASVPLAPRRLPRYAQVPPFLATPEDVASVPAAMARDFTTADALAALDKIAQGNEAKADPLHPPCARCGSPTIDASGWESPPILCTNPDCPTNQPESFQRPPRDPFAGMGDVEAVQVEEEIEAMRERADVLRDIEGDR